ncbi:MAG: hypothetical protein JWP49_1996 [Phenylobacterium sp.]|nr:hypothetical protein [Phenylobacterium sp.]
MQASYPGGGGAADNNAGQDGRLLIVFSNIVG